jgi:uncharacterized protein YjbI with pentapeptide repeats
VIDRSSRGRALRLAVAASLVAAGLAVAAGPAQARAATCPTVNPSTGAVTPAPGPGVSWSGCDLSGANLSGADLKGAGLSGTDLTNADLTGADLQEVNLTGATLTGATLTGVSSGGIVGPPSTLPANWTLIDGYLAGPGADLQYANLTDQDLTGVDLSDANLTQARLNDVTLTSADLAGATLAGVISADITGTPAALPADWLVLGGYLIGPAANLSSAALANLDLSGLTLTGVDLNGADLADANLTGTGLDDAILTQVNLGGTNLTGASLAGEQSSQITGTPAELPANWSLTGGFLLGPSADLGQANLGGLDLAGADLSGADLSAANLVGTSLARADLNTAVLQGNLTGAQFAGANLTDASLAGATVTEATLAGATLTGAAGVDLTGTPASLPEHWSVRGGFLIGPGTGTSLVDADLDNLNLSSVDFSGLSLLRASLEHSNLTSANLTSANLTGADFTSANLTKADLDKATVSSTNFTATVWNDTTCPNGTNSDTYAHGRCYAPPPSSGFTATQLPLPNGAELNTFDPVTLSCPTTTECYGGGSYFKEGTLTVPALLELSGKQWSASAGPLPAGAEITNSRAALSAVACPSATRCLGAGNYQNKAGNQPLVASYAGRSWTATKAPLPANAESNPDALVDGMSCPSVTACFAVGQYSDPDDQGLLLHWSAGQWTASAAPVQSGTVEAGLDAVSCSSVSSCYAGGWQDGSGPQEPLLVRWSAGRWATVKAPLPAGAAASPQAVIDGLSCPAASQCVASGSYVTSKGSQEGMLLILSGTSWTAMTAPLPSDAGRNPSAQLNVVSCPATSDCTVGGQYTDTANQQDGLLLSWTGKAWSAYAAPTGAYNIRGLSCPTTKRCVAVSYGSGHPIGLTGP